MESRGLFDLKLLSQSYGIDVVEWNRESLEHNGFEYIDHPDCPFTTQDWFSCVNDVSIFFYFDDMFTALSCAREMWNEFPHNIKTYLFGVDSDDYDSLVVVRMSREQSLFMRYFPHLIENVEEIKYNIEI